LSSIRRTSRRFFPRLSDPFHELFYTSLMDLVEASLAEDGAAAVIVREEPAS
jgi:hypothetical protein